MEPLYNPAGVEERWQREWEEAGLYRPRGGERTFVIAVPPPNVTGALHMGHALNGTIQDVLIRWHRMRGFNTLWQPGYDHAGISTQNVIERQLAKEGKTRHVIMKQYRRLGASLDYSRERFTMDPDYVRAVMRFFVHLYERGWIYRAN